jgi:hypothetical protein
MKRISFILLLTVHFIGSNSLKAQNVYIPDICFKNTLIKLGIDINKDGEIQYSEALQVKYLNLENSEKFEAYEHQEPYPNCIVDLTGIEAFKNLELLNVYKNKIRKLSISGLEKLREIYFMHNELAEIQLSNLPDLTIINCSDNPLTGNISLSNLPNLIKLHLNYALFDKLIISSLPKLIFLEITNCLNLNSLTLSKLPSLENLYCPSNKLTKLNLQAFKNLKEISCESTEISKLLISNLKNFQSLYCVNTKIKKLNLKKLPSLINVNCASNFIEEINLKDNIENKVYIDVIKSKYYVSTKPIVVKKDRKDTYLGDEYIMMLNR